MRRMKDLQAKREKKRLRRLRLRKIRIACLVQYGAIVGAGIYQAMRDLAKAARHAAEKRRRGIRLKRAAERALLGRLGVSL